MDSKFIVRHDPTSQQTDFELDRRLIAASGLFDEKAYLRQAGPDASHDPVGHYVQKGWHIGLEPNASFPGSRLQPYFASAGFNGPPAISWLTQRSAGWEMPGDWDEVQRRAMKVRASGLFDEAFYVSQLGKALDGLDAAIHYATVGERMGVAPSVNFDPVLYMESYPDVAIAGMNCLLHYHEYGRQEGRIGVSVSVCKSGLVERDPSKENVILVVHETSRTGAPVLGWNIACRLQKSYNIYTVRIGEGELTAAFESVSVEVHGPFMALEQRNPTYIGRSLLNLFERHKFKYAIVNSAESRNTLECCARNFVPTVLLMHEFASYVKPLSSLASALDLSTEIVFPAQIVAQSARDIYPPLGGHRAHVVPQGASQLPDADLRHRSRPNPILDELIRKHDEDGTFIVLGAGSVQIRKGVDLFLSAAAAALRSKPARKIQFVWVGHGYFPEQDAAYSVYLYEQLNRSGLEQYVTFLDAVPDLEPVYRIADLFFLSSRLDPFPNVAIDVISRGIPLICFNAASGTAELLLNDPETAVGVVDYLDAHAAGQLVIEFSGNEARRQRVAEATRRLAGRDLIGMDTYVSRLDAIGIAAGQRMTQRFADAKTLVADPTFDQDMYVGLNQLVEVRVDTINRYLATASARGPLFNHLRRAAPGFHSYRYAADHPAIVASGVDPLADFVRRGKPDGPWFLPVLRADDPEDQIQPLGRLRVALHAHFHYPELAAEFLSSLEANSCACDLLVTTNEATKAAQLRSTLSRYPRGKVDIRIVPNRGRDIGPLLTEFGPDFAKYDLIGHVHAKRSLILGDPAIGDNWRHFLWQNLIGGRHSMLDRIVAAFERHEGLGLVFPSDPHFMSWNDNRAHAEDLAGRMGWTSSLPGHFDFPLGTMFWTRRDALRPLLNLGLDWSDYPDEPLPYDGTILHAIERLMPTVCQIAGFTSAVTHVSGLSW